MSATPLQGALSQALGNTREIIVNFVKALLAVIAGLIAGSVVNMGLIMISGHVIPPPAGADMTTAEGLKASMHLLEPRHFIFPFLAHALGALSGAFVATKLASKSGWFPAIAVGTLFLVGGVLAARMIPAPTWFIGLDLLLAYLPTAWIGYILASVRRSKPSGVA